MNMASVKEGEVVFDQNVEMICTAGKKLGPGKMDL
jgi:hypothetical protein